MLFEMENCGNCKTCEIACCYHHTGVFGPAPSSFRVKENPDGKGYLIMIADADEGAEIACDDCKGEEVPLCMEVCEEADLLEGFLKEFRNQKSNPQFKNFTVREEKK
jgi:Fe-S-cluster-containing hydrogenase component 2